MGMRRRGVDTSFRLRNVVNRLGVEQVYKVCSPMIKEIKVVRRAVGRKGAVRDLGKAKVNWIRDKPSMLANIAAALKSDKLASNTAKQNN
jgi:large subunit ribosomal protein L19